MGFVLSNDVGKIDFVEMCEEGECGEYDGGNDLFLLV